MDIRPLDIMLVDPEVAPQVAVPAYDLLSTADRHRILSGEPLSFLNAIRLPEDYRQGIERGADRHLRDSQTALRRMVADGVFRRTGGPSLFIYRLTTENHQQTAVVAAVPVQAYNEGLVLRHEETRDEKLAGLRSYIENVKASSSPVCLAYRPVPEIDELVATIVSREPEVDFVAYTGTRQEIWTITDIVIVGQIIGLFRDVPRMYITDGHHRAAATACVDPESTILAAIFPTDQLQLVAYHRCLRDLGTETTAGLLGRLAEAFDIETRPATERPPAPAPGKIVMCLDGNWHQLTRRDNADDLDVVVLQDRILDRILGVADPRSDPRLACVTSRIDADAIGRWVNNGVYDVAFLLHPMSLDQLMAASEAGSMLPPKSSWFTPKAGSGIFLRFDG